MSLEFSHPNGDLRQSLSPPSESLDSSSSTSKQSEPLDNIADGDLADLSVEDEVLYLHESDDPKAIITKASTLLLVYFLCWSICELFIWYDVRSARIVYRTLTTYKALYVSLVVVVLIKLVGGFTGPKVRAIAPILYFVDLAGSSIFVFSLYFALESAYASQYLYNCFYVIIISVGLFGSALGFFLSSILTKKTYNPVIGIILMTMFSLCGIMAFVLSLDSVMIRGSRIMMLVCILMVVNLYLAFNSAGLLRHRLQKFQTSDGALVFFAFWTDFLFVFWAEAAKDLLGRSQKKKPALQEKALSEGRGRRPDPSENLPKPAKKTSKKTVEFAPQHSIRASDDERNVQVEILDDKL